MARHAAGGAARHAAPSSSRHGVPLSSALSPLAARIEGAGLWPTGASILAACSGGPDSIALVLGLDELRRAGRLDLAVAHVHHGLRGRAADAEAARVRELAEALGVPALERRGDAAAERARRRRGLEEAARALRHEALEDMRREARAGAIALAHTADDQAETLLLRLLRGAGPDGLAAMSGRSGRLVRPLLRVRRAELRRVLREAGVAWSSDPTNWAPTSARSLVRELLERVEVTLDERVVDRLCETADLLREDASLLAADAERAGAAARRGTGRLAVGGLGALHPALARRVVRGFLREGRPGAPPPSLDAVRRVLRMATAASSAPATAHVAGLAVRRDGDVLDLGPEPPWRAPDEPVVVEVPFRARWAGGVVAVQEVAGDELVRALAAARAPEPGSSPALLLDPGSWTGPLVLRARRPGDAMVFRGVRRHVGKLMGELGVPSRSRDRRPLACAGDTILAIAGLAVADPFRARPDIRRAILLEWRDGARAPDEGAAPGPPAGTPPGDGSDP